MPKLLSLIFCSLIVSSCNTKPTIYNGAQWGMSIEDVQQLYKVHPENPGPASLHYTETFKNSNAHYEVTYEFDATKGLNQISISATSINSDINKENDLKNFETFFINKQQVRLVDEALDFSLTELGSKTPYIYDRIYASSEANIRSGTKKGELYGNMVRCGYYFYPSRHDVGKQTV